MVMELLPVSESIINAFSGGDVAMLNMGSWFISDMITNLSSGEYDSSLCGNWGMVKYPYAENVSEINSILDSIHGSIMTGELSIDEGIAKMNAEVKAIAAR